MATITYKGVTHRPNNATSPDGELALCLNLVNDNGTLTPLEQPTHIGSLPSNMQALFIHQSATYHHIIIYDFTNNSVIWADYAHLNDINWGKEKHWGYIIKGTREMPSVTALGNTLILTFKNQPLQYAVWKKGAYSPLGSHPPFIPMQFALLRDNSTEPLCSFTIDQCDFDNDSTIAVNKTGYFEIINEKPTYRESQVGTPDSGDEEIITYGDLPANEYLLSQDASLLHFTDTILSELNKAIAEHTSTHDKEAYFVFPFFIRYAIRFYDGTLTQHSYPVLMIPNTNIICKLTDILGSVHTTKTYINRAKGTCMADLCKLHYWFSNTPDIDNWKDIIQSIDVYMSAPIYTYDQNGYVKGWAKKGSSYAITSLKVSNKSLGEETGSEEILTSPYQFILPTKEEKDVHALIKECSLFYKVQSIKFDDIKDGDWIPLQIKGSTLGAITSQEVMTDDYNTHNGKQADVAIIYNSRLNIIGVSEHITADVPFDCQFAYLDKPNYNVLGAITIADNYNTSHNLLNNNESRLNYLPRYFYFPSTKASEIFFSMENENGYTTYRIPLKEHPGLNGAVYFRGFGDNMPERVNSIPTGENSITIHYPNKLYTSNVDNPFTFRPENINTIGSGNIRALSAATQAISQGQFGAFPLYAFTDEGIWALAVSGTGGWTSIQPVTRDVITEGTIPLSLDNAIAFFSAKGLMLLQGGDVSCMSAMLDTNTPSSVLDNIVTDLSDDFIAAVKRFPKSAALAYDYAHSRIYALAPNAHWIYSTKLGTWSHAEGGNLGDYALNNYPNTIIVRCDKDKGQHLYSLNDNCEYYNYAEFITRPLHFGTHSLRTIRALVTRGLISNEVEISVYLYASMDNNSFIPIAANGSSANIHRISGSAYRSHCLHVIAPHLTPSFAINSTEFDVVTKHSHKLR